jgi:ribonuclease HI
MGGLQKCALEHGIQLNAFENDLRWSGGDGSSLSSTRNLYRALSESMWLHTTIGWCYKLWKWNLALKLKLFFLLLLRNKVLTWEYLLAKGWEGPSFCILCRRNLETLNHLFISCPFTRQVWFIIAGILNFKLSWEGNTVEYCLSNWVRKHPNLITLPAYVCWFLWLERNNLLFNNESILPQVVAFKSVVFFNASVRPQKSNSQYRIKRPPQIHQLVGWFDGASTADGSNSGAGGVFSLNANISFKWTFNTGVGTNNRAELLGMWTTLYLSLRLHITGIQIIGDSKLIIDWCNGSERLQSLVLEGWKEQIKRLSTQFETISYIHTFREFNKDADVLSKNALRDQNHRGVIIYTQWEDNKPVPSRHIKVF